MQSIEQSIKELFQSCERSDRNIKLVQSLLPRYIGYLRKLLWDAITGYPYIEGCVLKKAFEDAFNDYLTAEELKQILEHDFFNNGGYFYELGCWFSYVFYYTELSDGYLLNTNGISTKYGDFEIAHFTEPY